MTVRAEISPEFTVTMTWGAYENFCVRCCCRLDVETGENPMLENLTMCDAKAVALPRH